MVRGGGVATRRGPHHRATRGIRILARLGRLLAGASAGLGDLGTRDGQASKTTAVLRFWDQDLWTFRRIRYGGHYVDPVSDVTLVNWPQVD